MIGRTLARALTLGLAVAALYAPARGGEPDRLERFRQLAVSGLGAVELAGPSPEALQEIYALLDDEILDNLAAGSVFAAPAFLQERLDGFGEAWGGSAFRVLGLPGATLMVVGVQLSPTGWGNSIRVYRGAGPGAELLAAIHRSGSPRVWPMPPTRRGQGQFLALWVGPPSSRGTPELRIELWRQEGGRVHAVWSTADLFGGDFFPLSYEVRGQEIMVRYEAHYPGWKPGCEGQTEQEEHYRYAPAAETFLLSRRQVHNGWHRELHATVEQLLTALRQGEQRALSALGLTPELRRALPDGLEPEPVCDLAVAPEHQLVTVSAVTPEHPRPWGLRFRRTPRGWRLVGAAPLP